MTTAHENKSQWKQKLLHELKELMGVFLFLALFFCAFTTYRRIVMQEAGLSYYHYGFAVVKALILAKVIVIGQCARLGRIFDGRPLIVPTLYKVIVFSLLTILFEMVEHFIAGLIHGQGVGGFREAVSSLGVNELLARTLVTLAAFIPFFAFKEIARVLGEGRLTELFFQRTLEPHPKT